ncbi:MAG TPA: ABC transporter permease [Gemmatimonadota bacterium]|nr:ABC transporter permease [Gemmatimonadota bacterium]
MATSDGLRAAGRWVDGVLKGWALRTQEFFTLAAHTLRSAASRPFYFRDLVQQMDTIGVSSVGIVVLTGLFTGMVLALQSAVEMRQFGATIYMGRLVGASTVRELGPVLTALMVTGRAGSGMAAQLGAMRVTEQIDALDTMGVDPVRKLVVPRFLAGLVMMPVLTLVTDVVAIAGGLIIALVKLHLTAGLYLRSVWLTLAETGFIFRVVPIDLFSGLVKPLAFGAIMSMTGCYFGLRTTGGTEGVGRATTKTVVTASVLVLAADYFLTQLIIATLIE